MMAAVRWAVLVLVAAGFGGAALADDALFMPIGDVFPISGVGMAATGTIVAGSVHGGDKLEVVGIVSTAVATVVGLQVGSKNADTAGPGEEVAVLLRGVDENSLQRGQALATPGSLAAHTKITAEITMLAEGGRKTPVADGYRPLLRIWTHSVSGTVSLGDASLAPGGKATAPITLSEPAAVRVGDMIEVTEGGRPVGSAVVVSVDD